MENVDGASNEARVSLFNRMIPSNSTATNSTGMEGTLRRIMNEWQSGTTADVTANPPSYTPVSLTDVLLSSDALTTLADDTEAWDELKHLLPESHNTVRSTVDEYIRSPQLRQSLLTLDEALSQSETQLALVFASLGLTMPVDAHRELNLNGPVGVLVRALVLQQEEKRKTDDDEETGKLQK